MKRLASRSTFAALAMLASFAAPAAPAGSPSARTASPAAATAAGGGARPAIKIFLSDPGIYRLTHADLVAAGWPASELASSRLRMRRGEVPVAIAIEDGGDGRFGSGDALSFAGDRLAGDHGYYNEYSSLNVYWLVDDPSRSSDAAGRVRSAAGLEQAVTGSPVPPSHWQRRIRLEEDRILLRYPHAGMEDQELWYWTKLSYLDADKFEIPVDLSDLDPAAARGSGGEAPAVEIAVEVRGWSRPRTKPSPDFADHAVEVLWNGAVVGRREWSGTERAETIAVRLPAAEVRPGIHRLALRVPERPVGDGTPLVDVSILNWMEIVAPRVGVLAAADSPAAPAPDEPLASGARQYRIEPRPAAAGKPATLDIPPGRGFFYFTDSGERYGLAAKASAGRRVELPAAGPGWVVPRGRFLAPRALEVDQPSSWKRPDRQADYLLVTHPRLREALAPLVALRRSQGLAVAEIDVRDIYDEWSGGVTDPRAIRDFVDYAFHHWRSPAPRFLLLVGDASWDGKNDHPAGASPDWAFRLSDRAEFIQNGSTSYTSDQLAASRNLVPTWGYGSAEGHAAGDNIFAAIDGEDEAPDLAVGRFPVVEPQEVAAIVAKIVAYESSPEPGDWRSRVLWVTNEESHTQRMSDKLSEELAPQGYSARKVYPMSVVPPDADDQGALRGAFDEGALIVHFFGHGGRYIWRTAAPDLASQRDLFDLSDVEALEPTSRLPLVLSMTCYSAPFDHPTADSIGEKLLREPAKGAVAVFAASWRNGPREEWSRTLLEELLRPGTVGEALMRAKRRSNHLDLIRQYNLLGDPAMRLALPQPASDPAATGAPGVRPEASVAGQTADGRVPAP